eukprot:TRINITY_DN20_c0_g1_i2.p1 TRINITY_DN20_c0_g1~~TRINITY_DN20_c0_g1_i2.p1  ORF type:complete len:136 (+),score=47.74 TRINITY_DN20_c0_g1_i2:137-544(+)
MCIRDRYQRRVRDTWYRHLHLTMKFISAYALCVLGGNDSPAVADITKVVKAAGAEVSDEDVKAVEDFVEEMAGQNFYELMANGLEKVKSCAGRGGGAAAPAAGASGAAAAPVEEKKKTSSSEDVGGGGGMFDDDY